MACEFFNNFDAPDLRCEFRKDCGLVTQAGANLEHCLVRLGSKQIGHESNHEGLRDGFIEADRQRHVLVGIRRNLGWHEEMPRHSPHRCHHPLIERRLAEFFAGKVGMDCNHLDHVPT